MEHGAVDDAQAEVGGVAAARVEIHIDRRGCGRRRSKPPLVDAEIVPLAGHQHVVVAVEPELAGAPGHVRRQSGDRGPMQACVSLPPKPPPIRRTSTGHEGIRQAKHARDNMLNLARVLGRGMHQERIVLSGNGKATWPSR